MDYIADTPALSNVQHFVAEYPPEELDSDFKRKYPPDAFGEEFGSGARVWKLYRDESTAHDKATLNVWNKTLDILLIFAGLFSAVATAFVIESYKLLQPDHDEYIANALFLALSARTPQGLLNDTLSLHDPSQFTPTSSSRWLNGVWFTSLVLSLAVAFLCILLKQWLEEYDARVSAPSPSPRDWCRRRLFLYNGVKKWGVPLLIATLPMLLHAALFLFLAGLSILLWSLDAINAAFLVLLSCAVLSFYVLSLILPFVKNDCPSSTPLLRLIRHPLQATLLRLGIFFSSLVPTVRGDSSTSHSHDDDQRPPPLPFILLMKRFGRACATAVHRLLSRIVPHRLGVMVLDMNVKFELLLHGLDYDRPATAWDHGFSEVLLTQLDALALRWLITACPAPEAVWIGFQALGGMPQWSPVSSLLRTNGIRETVRRCMDYIHRTRRNPGGGVNIADASRNLRSAIWLYGPTRALLYLPYGVEESVRHSHYYDLPVLYEYALCGADEGRWSALQSRLLDCIEVNPLVSPHFHASTALQLLYDPHLPLSTWLDLCHGLGPQDLPAQSIVSVSRTLLRVRGYTSCPLEGFHHGRPCGRQCAYELLSEIVNRRHELGLDEADAHVGLNIIIRHTEFRAFDDTDAWFPLENSNLLLLLGSNIFTSHDDQCLLPALANLTGNLWCFSRCYRKHLGLPSWTAAWERAIINILTAACRLQASGFRCDILLAERVSDAIVAMFSTCRDTTATASHVSILGTDTVAHLPLGLLKGAQNSAWTMLLSLPHRREWEADALGDILAASLCFATRRGVDVRAEQETFVAAPYLVRKFHTLQLYDRDCTSVDAHHLILIFRHCNEVHAGWSQSLLDRVLVGDDGFDASQRELFARIEAAAAALGPCVDCNGAAPQKLSIWRTTLRRVPLFARMFGPETYEDVLERGKIWYILRPAPDPHP